MLLLEILDWKVLVSGPNIGFYILCCQVRHLHSLTISDFTFLSFTFTSPHCLHLVVSLHLLHGGLEGNTLGHHECVQLDPAHPSQGNALHLLSCLVEEGCLGGLAGHLLVDGALVEGLKVWGDECLHLRQLGKRRVKWDEGLYLHLVQTSSWAGLYENAVDDGVLDHREVGGNHLLLLGQGEEGGGDEKEGYQGQPHFGRVAANKR